MRSLALKLVALLSWIYRIIPQKLRHNLVFGLFMLESRVGDPAQSLCRLYYLRDDLDRLLSERAMAYEGGEHPKHRLMQYHDFFVENIPPKSRVIDVGCGYGAVARTIAQRVAGCHVTGVEMDEERYNQALEADNPDNLDFHYGDALETLPKGAVDIVVLSNVLEHIEFRVKFLRRMQECLAPKLILIRVPHFERDWHVPMRKELGIIYFNDRTHFIEHQKDEFIAEVTAAGLEIKSLQTVWGEIWAICEEKVLRPGMKDIA